MILLSRTAQLVNAQEPVQDLRAKARSYIPRHACLPISGYDPPASLEGGGTEPRQRHQQGLFRPTQRRIRASARRRPSPYKQPRAAPRRERESRMAERVHGGRKSKENQAPAPFPQNCAEGMAVEAEERSPSHRAPVTTPTLAWGDLGF